MPPHGDPEPLPGTVAAQHAGEEQELFRAVIAATPIVWLKWLITLGIYEVFRRHTMFIVTSRRVIVRTGVVRRNERSIPMRQIQDISTHKGMFTGRVALSSAGGTLGVESFGPLWRPSVDRMSQAIEQLVAGT